MRKKLDTRFPAARIKKIMQADEDIGKIAMAVPLLVSKALELFLQDLCDRTYDITLQKGAKTMNSVHLKQCVQSFNVFDFLRDIVGKVPNLGGSDAAGEDKSAAKRRKVVDDEDGASDNEKKGTMHEMVQSHGSVRGKGRGRGRGRGKCGQTSDRETTTHYEKLEVGPLPKQEKQKQNLLGAEEIDSKDNLDDGKTPDVPAQNFDLNLELDENGDTPASSAPTPPPSSSAKVLEVKDEEYPGWSLADVEQMAIDPLQLANLNSIIADEDEDYDEDG